MIKLISFDFWDTLFKGDPEHSKARVSYISEKYNLDPEFVKIAIKSTKKWCDDKGVETLTCIPPGTQLYFLGKYLGLDDFRPGLARSKFYTLLHEYPPVCLMNSETTLKLANSKIPLCISCNTGFMGELETRWIVNQSSLRNVFQFELYSETIGMFKPNPAWFYRFASKVNILPKEVIHVGDNDSTDGQLCRNTGMHFVKVEPKNPDFSGIFEIIEREKNG